MRANRNLSGVASSIALCTARCIFGREYGAIRVRRGAPEPMYDGAGSGGGESRLPKPDGADEGRADCETRARHSLGRGF